MRLGTSAGLVLVGTGYGLREVRDPKSRLSGIFLWLMDPDLREEMTAERQVRRLGFDSLDVRHIVLTHLDFDHAGGLDDFPNATVHMLAVERDDAAAQCSWLDRQRYRPPKWSTRRVAHLWHRRGRALAWLRLRARSAGPAAGDPAGAAARAHAWPRGVTVQSESGWLLQAGDAYFHYREMDAQAPWCTPGLRACQVMLAKDRRARLGNQARLRALAHEQAGTVLVCCSHDNTEFKRLAGHLISALPDPVRSRAAPPQGGPSE